MAISPLDVVKIRLQVQPEPYTIKGLLNSKFRGNMKYSGVLQAFKAIIKEEGVRVRFNYTSGEPPYINIIKTTGIVQRKCCSGVPLCYLRCVSVLCILLFGFVYEKCKLLYANRHDKTHFIYFLLF